MPLELHNFNNGISTIIFSILDEASMMLLYGAKNIGKTLTQHIIHFGQGADSLSHDLIVSGGTGYVTGVSM